MNELSWKALSKAVKRYHIALWPGPGIYLLRKRPDDGVIVYARTDAGIGVKQQNDAGIKD
ncbi:hypothetical protein ACP80H_15180 [Escherichia coli]